MKHPYISGPLYGHQWQVSTDEINADALKTLNLYVFSAEIVTVVLNSFKSY